VEGVSLLKNGLASEHEIHTTASMDLPSRTGGHTVMMGTKIRTFTSLPREISLEELVSEDNFYRRLEATLDLSFVRELVLSLYAGGGRPSVDPVVFFKLQLVMFFEDIRSERLLMRMVADRLSVRWYLGYDLHESLPDHSSLTRIRERFGLSVFRRFFERILQECFDAGLVWGEELFFDATKVEANASLDSARSRSLVEGRLKEHLVGVFPEAILLAQEDEDHSAVLAGIVGPEGEERQALAQTNALRHHWIANNGRQERELVRWGYKRMADLRVSTTDPDASPMHQKKKGASRLGYQTHYVVDGGKARVIVDVLVTPAEVTENLPMQQMLFRDAFRWRLRPRSVTGDAAYGTRENIAAIEKAGVRAYTALPQQGKRTSLFTIEDFVHDAERDLYTCTAGETLRRQGYDRRGGYVRYAVRTSACKECPLKSKCTNSPKGRWVSRSLEGVSRKGGSVPRHRTLPQGPEEAGSVGRAAVWRGQGVAWFEEVQAKAAGESEHRGADDRFGAERQAACGLREQRPEKTGAGGRPPMARSRPFQVLWRPKASQEMPFRAIEAFSTGWGLLRKEVLGSSLPQATSKIRQNGSFRGYAWLPQEALCLRW
jgi:transposase